MSAPVFFCFLHAQTHTRQTFAHQNTPRTGARERRAARRGGEGEGGVVADSMKVGMNLGYEP